MLNFTWAKCTHNEVQHKSVLLLAILASYSQRVLVQNSFPLVWKYFAEHWLEFFCNVNFLPPNKKFTCPSGKLRTEFTSPIANYPLAPGYRTLLCLSLHTDRHHHHHHHHKTPFKSWTSHVPNRPKQLSNDKSSCSLALKSACQPSSTFQKGLKYI